MLLQAAKHRTDGVYQRLLHFRQSLPSTKSFWHANHFKTYTSKRNLSFVKQDPSKACDPVSDTCSPSLESRSSRSTVSSLDWSLCLFCQKKRKEKKRKHRGCKDLINVFTYDACQAIKNASENRCDNAMILTNELF